MISYRDKQRAKKRFEDAKDRAVREERKNRQQFQEATPKQILRFVQQANIQPGEEYAIVYRVTTEKQADNGDLEDQLIELRGIIESAGAKVVYEKGHIGPGEDSEWLEEVGEFTEQTRVRIISTNLTRLKRHPDAYKHRRNYDLQPRLVDLKELRKHTKGARIVTLDDPTAKPSEVWAERSRRGQRRKGRKGGRPEVKNAGYKKRRKNRLLPTVLEMLKQGKRPAEISRILGRADSTVRDWITSLETPVI